MLFNVVDLLWYVIVVALGGRLADRLGTTRQIKLGILTLMGIAFPACSLITGELTLSNIYAYMFIMTSSSALIISCSATYVMGLFPLSCRYTGFSVTDALGCIGGGITPFMMLLVSRLFNSNLACSIWLYMIAIPTFILVQVLERRRARTNAEGTVL